MPEPGSPAESSAPCRAPRLRPWRLARAGCALALACASSPAVAGKVRATFLFLDDIGERRQETLYDVRYGHFVRELLSARPPAPRQGQQTELPAPLPHRDRNIRRRSLLLQSGKIPFHTIRSIEVGYRPSGTPGTEEIVLRVTLETGLERDVRGTELRGFDSFRPPQLEGREGTELRSFPLPPFRREGADPASPRLEKVLFHNRPRGGVRVRERR